MCDVSSRGGVAIKELEEDWSEETSEMLGGKHCQGFINEVVGGTTVNQSGDGVGREGEGGMEEKGMEKEGMGRVGGE
ncbi:hypothetical protein C0989_001209, partial [Termitomyces sp. Mn162]